jgi:hypothetical protein
MRPYGYTQGLIGTLDWRQDETWAAAADDNRRDHNV